MSRFAIVDGIVGTQQVALYGLPDTTQRIRTGTLLPAYNDWWGGAEVMYVYAAGTIRQGGLCVITPTIVTNVGVRFEASECPNTANLGRPVAFAMTSATVGQFIWVMVKGAMPVNCQASVAADTAFGIAAVGQGGAVGAGKQVLGARILAAGATTVAKVGFANSNSTILTVANVGGWFIGAYLSGTGIGAAAVITDIAPDGITVTMSVVTTAQVNGTVTATYNNAVIFYNVAVFNRPIAQGPIT